MRGAVQYPTTVTTFLIVFTLYQTTASTHCAMNRQPKGALFHEDTFQPIIDFQLRTAFWAFLFPSFRLKHPLAERALYVLSLTCDRGHLICLKGIITRFDSQRICFTDNVRLVYLFRPFRGIILLKGNRHYLLFAFSNRRDVFHNFLRKI